MSKKLHNMAVLVEFLAGSGLAIFFHLVLHSPETAYTIFGIGIMLSLATHLLRGDIEQTQKELLEQYDNAHEITFAMAQISDPECHNKAQEIMAAAKRTIVLLQQGYIPQDKTEFYLEGAKHMEQANQQVKTVDLLTMESDTRGSLFNFYQATLRALNRGVKIIRVFVINREELHKPEVQKVLLTQLRDGIDVRVAYREEMPLSNDINNQNTNSSLDFTIYDDRVVMDVLAQPSKHFGSKVSKPAEVSKYRYLFDLIEHSARTIVPENDQIILAN